MDSATHSISKEEGSTRADEPGDAETLAELERDIPKFDQNMETLDGHITRYLQEVVRSKMRLETIPEHDSPSSASDPLSLKQIHSALGKENLEGQAHLITMALNHDHHSSRHLKQLQKCQVNLKLQLQRMMIQANQLKTLHDKLLQAERRADLRMEQLEDRFKLGEEAEPLDKEQVIEELQKEVKQYQGAIRQQETLYRHVSNFLDLLQTRHKAMKDRLFHLNVIIFALEKHVDKVKLFHEPTVTIA